MVGSGACSVVVGSGSAQVVVGVDAGGVYAGGVAACVRVLVLVFFDLWWWGPVPAAVATPAVVSVGSSDGGRGSSALGDGHDVGRVDDIGLVCGHDIGVGVWHRSDGGREGSGSNDCGAHIELMWLGSLAEILLALLDHGSFDDWVMTVWKISM